METPADHPDAVACIEAYFAELARRMPDSFDPALTTTADVEELTPPRGALLLVRVDGRARGVGCVKLLGDGERAEVKRMWLHPSVRGRGLATPLLRALEDRARDLGASTAVLDTHSSLGTVGVYEHAGYEPTGPFNGNPYPDWWGSKAL